VAHSGIIWSRVVSNGGSVVPGHPARNCNPTKKGLCRSVFRGSGFCRTNQPKTGDTFQQ